ncbi:12793_t:CDS:1, partial [Acaulospora colombiana]
NYTTNSSPWVPEISVNTPQLPQRQKLMDHMLQLSDPTTTTNRK